MFAKFTILSSKHMFVPLSFENRDPGGLGKQVKVFVAQLGQYIRIVQQISCAALAPYAPRILWLGSNAISVYVL